MRYKVEYRHGPGLIADRIFDIEEDATLEDINRAARDVVPKDTTCIMSVKPNDNLPLRGVGIEL